MNRYDWIFLAFRGFVKAYQIKEVQNLVATMTSSTLDGKAKRDAVIEQVFPALVGAKRFVVKALVELALAKLTEEYEKRQ
jgi:hypothetical protein